MEDPNQIQMQMMGHHQPLDDEEDQGEEMMDDGEEQYDNEDDQQNEPEINNEL